jgi:hypothetical protein
MRLFFQPADERARPWQSDVKVVDPEEGVSINANKSATAAR